ncbi:alpha/beta hydrolase [Streptomyces sp. NBC_00589]|uniref:alpha/beta hydrolase n=1 Tax=Streptomyces sp. NBC_00589 TaxID=2975785 RepID=UPI002E81D390|nr:alpha/beta hydrolase [Streptomyces sp. NBC_00589]
MVRKWIPCSAGKPKNASSSSGQAQFPAQLYDIKGAIRWLCANSATYHLDPDRIAIMGDSSDGWTTAMAAVTGDIPALEGDVGTRGPSSTGQATVPFHSPTDFLQMDAHMPDNCTAFTAAFGLTNCHSDARSPESGLLGCTITACPGKVAAANPLTYIGDQRTPPFLILHGEQHAIVPYHQSRLLYDKLAAAGDDVRLISFPKAEHGHAHGTSGRCTVGRGDQEVVMVRTSVGGTQWLSRRAADPSPTTSHWQSVLASGRDSRRPMGAIARRRRHRTCNCSGSAGV